MQALRDGLAAAGLAAKVIYSGGIDVDILAQVGRVQQKRRLPHPRVLCSMRVLYSHEGVVFP